MFLLCNQLFMIARSKTTTNFDICSTGYTDTPDNTNNDSYARTLSLTFLCYCYYPLVSLLKTHAAAQALHREPDIWWLIVCYVSQLAAAKLFFT